MQININRHRKAYIGPFGGVIKYSKDALPDLDQFQFESERKASYDVDLRNDLRGYFPAHNFGPFMIWFKSRISREQSDTVLRELKEELAEANIPAAIANPILSLQFTQIRVVHEGPYSHPGLPYPTFRYFEVYKPDTSDTSYKAIGALAGLAGSNPSIHLVSKEEIDKLRSNMHHDIGGHARYFYTSEWHGFEPPGI